MRTRPSQPEKIEINPMFHAFELTCLHFIHQFRSPPADVFFKALDFFDRPEFFFILIPIIWLGHGWKAGLRLFYILMLSSLANHVLKEFFLSPRPFHLDPALGIIQVKGYGFPSGAAQTAVLLSGLLLKNWKSRWRWVAAPAYFFLLSFSRLYLGVHFPTDILTGWLVGGILLGFYLYVMPLFEQQLGKLKPLSLFCLSQLLPLLLMSWQFSIPVIRIGSTAMGIGIGLFVSYSYEVFLPPVRSAKDYALRSLIGISGTFSCYALTLQLIPSNAATWLFFQFLVLGIWLSLGSRLICRSFLNMNPSLEAN